MTKPSVPDAGHAFISYVHEDAKHVDRVERVLRAAGIPVWRDTADLWPGEDWKLKIRKAITNNSLVFIACFSAASEARDVSYQNEELLLAVEQFRLRPPNRAWIIPVRFSNCTLPEYDLGAGRTLNSFQRVDLFGRAWEEGAARLVAGTLRVLGEANLGVAASSEAIQGLSSSARASASVDIVKSALLDPQRQIELAEFVQGEATRARESLISDVDFPTRSPQLTDDVENVRYVVEQAMKYWAAVEPLADILAAGCAWGRPEHAVIWKGVIQLVAGTVDQQRSGQTMLIDLRRLPVLPLLYSAGLASIVHQNFVSLKAVAIDATVKKEGIRVPVVGVAHVWGPFASFDVAASVLARVTDGEEVSDDDVRGLISRGGKRHTPVSDYLHSLLRPSFQAMIPDDDDYTESFDRLEVMLALMADDAKSQAHLAGVYLDGSWYGSYTWRYSSMRNPLEAILFREYQDAGEQWGPLVAGIFGGSRTRVDAAFERVIQESARIRAQRF
jgi:TIR domain